MARVNKKHARRGCPNRLSLNPISKRKPPISEPQGGNKKEKRAPPEAAPDVETLTALLSAKDSEILSLRQDLSRMESKVTKLTAKLQEVKNLIHAYLEVHEPSDEEEPLVL